MDKKVVKNIKRVDNVPEFVYNIEVADNHNYFINGVLLHNSPNVVLDEASLIDDDIESKIFRMLGDSMDNFYLKIGNPFRRNHFFADYKDPAYFVKNYTWRDSYEEGLVRIADGVGPQITMGYVEEVRKKPNFEVLYENKFPSSDEMDAGGWSHLITDTEYDMSFDEIVGSAEFGG